MDVNQNYCQSCHLMSRNGFIIRKIMRLTDMLQMHGQCYHVIRMHLQRPESIAKRFPEETPFWARLGYN
jgi:hypothetical protein